VDHDEAVFGGDGHQGMWSVARGGPGLVAVGYDAGAQAAAVWTSPDGRQWSRVGHDEAVFGGSDGQGMFSLTRGGPGLVAVGCDAGAQAAPVWTSPDGRQWSRVDHDEAVFGGSDGQLAMSSVVGGEQALVAVAGPAPACVFSSQYSGAAVWISD
jgi:hypothetical protein